MTDKRTEPMPDPIPLWLKEAACAECNKERPGFWRPYDFGKYQTLISIARLCWERGDAEPVDKLEMEARKLAAADGIVRTKNQTEAIMEGRAGQEKVAIALAALKRGMEMAREVGS